MSKYDDSKTRNGNGRSPPPPPVSRPIRSSVAEFGGAIRPMPPERRPPGQQIERVPNGAKNTASIATPLPAAVAALNSGATANRPSIETPYISGQTLMPAPLAKNPEQEKKNAENEVRFLRFANALYRASEIMQEDWVNWIVDSALLRENVAHAVEFLNEKRNENENYASDHKMMKAFSGMLSKDERLNDYLAWMKGKEKEFTGMAHVYATLSMGPLTPYPEVIGACRELANCDAPGQADKGAAGFLAMVGDCEGYEGTDYMKGELYKKMFDSWYVRRAARAMVEVYDIAKIEEERGKALQLAGDLNAKARELYQDNERLRRASGSTVSPQILEEVHRMRAETVGLEANAREAEERAARFYRMLELTDGEAEALEEEVEKLGIVAEKRYALMAQQVGMVSRLNAEMEELKAQNAQIIRELREENLSLKSNEEKMRGTIAALNAKIAMRDSGADEEFGEEDVGRPTVLSGQYSLPDEVKEAVAGMEEDVPRELDGIARLVSATREREKPVVPAREPTGTIDLEDVEELPAARERGRFWNSLPGRVIDNLFVFGFAGAGDKAYPPKQENYANDAEYYAADREYRSWYGQAGRAIRKTLEGTRKNWKKITAVATGAAVLAAATTGYFVFAPVQGRPEEVALRELQMPAVTQVAVADEAKTEKATVVQKVEPTPEPLAKPLLSDVLAKHGIELGEGTHIVNFYKGFSVEDVQERYVILEEILKSDEQMEKYERKYIEKPILEMYADFLNTAMAYAQLEGQSDAEKAGAKALGETVAKRLENRVQQKRIKEKIGKERASELGELATHFTEFVASLPSAKEVQAEQEPIVELPVVTPEELEEMKKAGEEPEMPVVILPDKSAEKPFDIKKAMAGVVDAEFEVIDTPEKVNGFARKAGKAEGLEKKFLMQAHLSRQIVENGLEHKMSERRIMYMHLETMNAAILFAMEEGQGMTAISESLNAFDIANEEVTRILGYKKMKDVRKNKAENVTWLRNRAKELKDRVDSWVPTAVPKTVKLDRNNEYAAMQTKVFADHGLSIFDHPLKIREQLRGKKINSFDRFIIEGKLVEEVLGNPKKMDGLSKAEQFEMLDILADFLDATRKAANEPKHWPEGYTMDSIMLGSMAIDVSDEISGLRKNRKGLEPKERTAHLYFPVDVATFQRLGEAKKAFDEQLNYNYRQKPRMLDTNGE